MIFIRLALLLIISIKSRKYDSISEIYKNFDKNFHKIFLTFNINGTHDYFYYFTSEDILYYFDHIHLSDSKKEIIYKNQHIKILFNLKIYENNSNFFDYSSNEFFYSENIKADIAFKYLKFYKKYDDFSFDFEYEIDNINNDVLLHFENIDKLNLYKYLFFEDKNDIYENRSLSDLIKVDIVNNFASAIQKYLIYYPVCDALYYFKTIVKYFTGDIFSIYLKVYGIGYYVSIINRCKILSLNYDEIFKDNRTLIIKNVNITMFIEMFELNPDDYDDELLIEETDKFIIDYMSIDQNMTIQYGKSSGGEEYTLDAFKLVVNKAIDACFKPTNSSKLLEFDSK